MGIRDLFRRRPRWDTQAVLDIEDDKGIRAKLKELCGRRQNCELTIGEDIFTSIFLNLHSESFVIDVLMPVKGNGLLQADKEFHVSYLENSSPFTMNCRFLGTETEEGFEALAFGIPEVINNSNKRSFFRVKPNATSPVRMLLDVGFTRAAEEEVQNISAGGFSLKTQLAGRLHDGDTIDRIDITLPSGGWISCKGKVIRVSGTTIGIELEEISYNDRRDLIRYVSGRQHEDLSRRRKE